MTEDLNRPFAVYPRQPGQTNNADQEDFSSSAPPVLPPRRRFYDALVYVRQSAIDRQVRRRWTEGFLTGVLVSALAVGAYALYERSTTSTSPTILYPGQCKTLPPGSVATGSDFTYDGASSYKDPNVGTIIEAFKPVTVCATDTRATYQNTGTTDTGTMDAIANNYKTQMQNSGCAGGLGCTYITTVIIK